jgi:pyrimidine deaminase RibD-like protein
MTSEKIYPSIAAGDHEGYMEYALEQARQSPPAPTKFCVGAVLVDADKNEILSTGWSLELPDNNPADPGKTHAEQCCFIKVAQKHNLPEARLCEVLPQNTILYTTMEPCNKRLSGNKPCVDRILGLKDCIKTVYIGIKEPENFIDQSVLAVGRKRLQDAGVKVIFLEGMEDRIMKVSLAGH